MQETENKEEMKNGRRSIVLDQYYQDWLDSNGYVDSPERQSEYLEYRFEDALREILELDSLAGPKRKK